MLNIIMIYNIKFFWFNLSKEPLKFEQRTAKNLSKEPLKI